MDSTKKFVDLQNLKLYNSLIKGEITKRIKENNLDYSTTEEVRAMLPDTWSFRVSYYPSAENPYVTFSQIKKNGENFTGNLTACVIKIANDVTLPMMSITANSPVSNGVLTAQLNSSQIEFLKEADTLLFTLYTADGSEELASYLLPVKAASVADGEAGFVTGDQVYDYVTSALANIEGVMHFKGTIAATADIPVTADPGDVYIVSTAYVVYQNETLEPGDMMVYVDSETGWKVVQANLTTPTAITSGEIDEVLGITNP